MTKCYPYRHYRRLSFHSRWTHHNPNTNFSFSWANVPSLYNDGLPNHTTNERI